MNQRPRAHKPKKKEGGWQTGVAYHISSGFHGPEIEKKHSPHKTCCLHPHVLIILKTCFERFRVPHTPPRSAPKTTQKERERSHPIRPLPRSQKGAVIGFRLPMPLSYHCTGFGPQKPLAVVQVAFCSVSCVFALFRARGIQNQYGRQLTFAIRPSVLFGFWARDRRFNPSFVDRLPFRPFHVKFHRGG